ARAEPTRHCAGDFVADEVTKDAWMPGVRSHRATNSLGDLFAGRSFTQELDVFFPWKRHQHAQTGSSTTIQKPAWRRVVNAHEVQTSLTHESEVDVDLLGPAKVVPFGVRLERTVSDAFNKKFFVALEKKFRSRANSRVRNRCHIERSLPLPRDQSSVLVV